MQNKLRIAVVGFGLIGKRHCELISQSPQLDILGVCDSDTNRLSLAKSFTKNLYQDLPEMLSEIRPDGIILATPTPLHKVQGIQCLSEGIPLLIEKPITVTSQEAISLIEISRSNDIHLLTGHHRRHNGIIKEAKKVIMDGAIGEIRSVQATCWFYKPDHYFNASPWRTKKGAGPLSVNLVHDIDLLRYLCGEIKSVFATSVPSSRGFENEDTANGIIKFASGAIGTINISDSIVSPWSWELTSNENSSFHATNQSCYIIGGSKGSLSLPDLNVWCHNDGLDWMTPINATQLKHNDVDPLKEQIEHFARVIRKEESPIVSGEEGLKSLKVIEAIMRSCETCKEVLINASI